MKVDIRDRTVFDSLDPLVIIRYIVANGWQEKNRISGEMAVYELDQGDAEPYRVWIPLSRKFSDYASVMSNAFKTLAEAEEKAQLSLLDDLQTKSVGDVVRVGSENRLNRADHTLSFDEGIALHQQAKDMALAGAWNASIGETKRAIYPQSTRVEISTFLQNLRLAQTERGSYIIRLLSPIDQRFLDQIPLSQEIPIDLPFERRAIVELMNGLKALKQVSYDSNRRGKFDFQMFKETVQDGVSANLCDAVAPIPTNDNWHPLRVGVTWCDILPTPYPLTTNYVEFEPPLMPYIREAAIEFKRRNPREIVLKGAVTDLHRPSKATSGAGEVRIYGTVDKRARYVRVSLTQEDYELAVDAHKKYREVSVSGILAPRTGVYILKEPRNFHVVEGDLD